MAIITNTVCYLDAGVVLEGFFAFDDSYSGRRPTVLISHAWAGRDEFVQEKAICLAKLGYMAFALDMYGKGILGTSTEENSKLMQPFLDDRQMLQQRILAAVAAVKLMPWVDETNIAAIGFCFGGLCVLDLARTGINIKGVASFHGFLAAPNNLQQQAISAKVLILHGNDDPMVPATDIIAIQQELTQKGSDWQLHNFGNAMHAFTNPKAHDVNFGTVYQEKAAQRAWLMLQNFLAEIFN